MNDMNSSMDVVWCHSKQEGLIGTTGSTSTFQCEFLTLSRERENIVVE